MATESHVVHCLSRKVIQKIQQSIADQKSLQQQEGGIGFLYGHKTDCINVTASSLAPSTLKSGNFVEIFTRNRCIFPVGVDPMGIFYMGPDVHEITNLIPMGAAAKVPDQMVVLHATETVTTLYMYTRITKEMEQVEFTEVKDDPLVSLTTVRVSTTVELKYAFSTKNVELQRNCIKAVRKVAKQFSSDSSNMYEISDCNVIVGGTEIYGAEQEATIQSLLDHQGSSDAEKTGTRKQRKPDKQKQPKLLYAEVVEKLTQTLEPNFTPFAPVIRVAKDEELLVLVFIPLSGVVMIPSVLKLAKLPDLFGRALCRQLELCQDYLTHWGLTDIPALEVSHFKPMNDSIVISLITAQDNKNSTENIDWRRDLHQRLQLPTDRPCFRTSNKYRFPKDVVPGSLLVNPHEGLPPSSLKSGTVSTVYGYYHYHHYMQDNFNDNKWGCAYRSLQTLISWFNLQGYSDIPVPSHREIQQTLVDIGDKQSSFVGTREWIGSTEVNFVLEKLINVTCKIKRLSSGKDMAGQGRELIQHFDTQGTPIMIGGGELAHTILGVHYDDQLGGIRFLILDPHYTEAENLQTIQDKGWCGWKGEEFWRKDCFYNMCMPQRPKDI